MKTKLTILTTVTLLGASMLLGQRGPRGGGDRAPSFDGLVAALDLTEAQLTQLQENAASGREATQLLMQDIRPLQEQIRAELDKDAPDPALVGDLTVKVDAIHDKIGEVRDKTHADAVAILTPAQQETLTTLASSEEKTRETFGVIRTAAMLGLLEGPGPGGFGHGPGHGPGFGGMEGMRGPGSGRRAPTEAL
ncbi:MAG: periplasmic heavy metal sensor [Acidobacteria bacterium]|nr:periplasmic heavy metal sensor [Acidobacteriota bacterium]